MSPKSIKDIPASIRQRLLNYARANQRTFNELIQYYAMERFLYRLSKSSHSDRFILKCALMLRAWRSPESRPTMDIDMLGNMGNNQSNIIALIRDILTVEVPPDSIVFDIDSIFTEVINEDADYEGIRIRCRCLLDTARINLQIDIGFGDIIFPKPETIDLPTILNTPRPRILGYGKESAIAEKLEVMVKRGILNSRMKDFYDIWLISRQFDFEKAKLAKAIKLTFKQRGTSLAGDIAAFTESFAEEKQMQWEAFSKKIKQSQIPDLIFLII